MRPPGWKAGLGQICQQGLRGVRCTAWGTWGAALFMGPRLTSLPCGTAGAERIPFVDGKSGKEFSVILNLPYILLAKANDSQALGQWGGAVCSVHSGVGGEQIFAKW